MVALRAAFRGCSRCSRRNTRLSFGFLSYAAKFAAVVDVFVVRKLHGRFSGALLSDSCAFAGYGTCVRGSNVNYWGHLGRVDGFGHLLHRWT